MVNILKKSFYGYMVEKPLAASFSNQYRIIDSSGQGLVFHLLASPYPLLCGGNKL